MPSPNPNPNPNPNQESNWVAAHAFATGGHAWAADYRVVLSLEG